ncbi:MAG: Rad52/Rad22 family DNA repair protein [Terriglobia bacterium]|nr:Rad52/Rad22 family DNA repair protein [Terriglobia bacterium]
MSGFAPAQIKKLVRSLDPAKIRIREAEGKPLRYIEGWFAIQEANAIFGFAGWDRQMVHCEKLYERTRGTATAVAYSARVRIRVRAGGDLIIREGTGFGTACEPDLAQAHERALKGAESVNTLSAHVT